MTHLSTADRGAPSGDGSSRGPETSHPLPRVLLADDQEEMRIALASMLAHECEIVGVAENGQRVLELVLTKSPDVLLLDIFMPVLSGIEVAARLNASGCLTKVVFVTIHDDPDFVRTAMSVGALGYILKTHLAADLIPSIRSVMENRLYISHFLHSLQS